MEKVAHSSKKNAYPFFFARIEIFTLYIRFSRRILLYLQKREEPESNYRKEFLFENGCI